MTMPRSAIAAGAREHDQAACAHLLVRYSTSKKEDGTTSGWWECSACRFPFAPVYPRGIDSITEYAKLANVTLADRVRKSAAMTELNAATGIASEAGEINEITKKRYFHDHPNTPETELHMKKELGDLAWYWALMCFSYNFDPAEILALNIEKLKARYPDGFSTERSLNRRPDDI